MKPADMRCPHKKGCHALPFEWPAPPLKVILVEPEIPPNTGNIARLCAGTGTSLVLAGPLGFRLHDRAVRRAGLDYWDQLDLIRLPSLETAMEKTAGQSRFFFSTRGKRSYYEARYAPGDALFFGSESRGLPQALLERFPQQVYSLPIKNPAVRAMNLSNSVAAVLYEALRQIDGGGLSAHRTRAAADRPVHGKCRTDDVPL